MASITKFSLLRLSLNRISFQNNSGVLPKFLNESRHSYSSPSRTKSEDRVVVADNGSTIVCWHPESKFPYECSLPLPEPKETHPILNVQSKEVDNMFNMQNPQFQREYLMKMTHTTKHRWFPKPAKKFAKKTKPDREFL